MKKKKEINFASTHKPNKYQGKKNVSVIISVVAMLVLSITLGVTVAVNQANQGKIKYDKYTELTAKPGQEYTTVDKYGNEYDVKEDGMYCKTEYGYMKVNYGKPLGKYNTYNYVLESGASATFTLNKDKTFDYVFTYADGGGYKASGKYVFNFGIDSAFQALDISDPKEFEEAFMYSSAVINPNDLFVVTLLSDDIKYFDSNNKEVTYEQTDSKYHNSFDDIERNTQAHKAVNVVDELVIYLYKDETTGELEASAYDTVSQLLFNPADINGRIIVKETD